ncbi:MAG: TadA family conjugal transfer-associated ATPase, partial [Nocardioidaceae bacterium]
MTVDRQILDDVRDRLARDGGSVTPAAVADALRATRSLVTDAVVLEVLDALRRDSLGAGPLDPLLTLDGVTDVLVNGPDEVYVDVGSGLELTSVRFSDDDDVRRLAQRLAAAAGRRLDDGSPYVDVRLDDGTRLHAVLSPLSRPGTCLSLRVPARRMWTLDELAAAGTVPGSAVGLLRDVVSARLAFVITGGTGSGKTTLLNALLSLVAPHERVVVVEDAGELRPDHPHVVSLEVRLPNIEGAGEVSLRTLVRQSLRMRPDRLVVGEVRGPEVVDLLAAMNTGHEGGCSTVHANSAMDLPARFEALGVTAGLTRDAVSAQLAAAVDVVLHLRRDGAGQRRLTEVGVVHQPGSGPVRVVPA